MGGGRNLQEIVSTLISLHLRGSVLTQQTINFITNCICALTLLSGPVMGEMLSALGPKHTQPFTASGVSAQWCAERNRFGVVIKPALCYSAWRMTDSWENGQFSSLDKKKKISFSNFHKSILASSDSPNFNFLPPFLSTFYLRFYLQGQMGVKNTNEILYKAERQWEKVADEKKKDDR